MGDLYFENNLFVQIPCNHDSSALLINLALLDGRNPGTKVEMVDTSTIVLVTNLLPTIFSFSLCNLLFRAKMIQDAVKIVTNRRRSGSVKKERWKTRVSLFHGITLFKECPFVSFSD